MFLTDILENSVQIFCRLDVQSHTQTDVNGYKKEFCRQGFHCFLSTNLFLRRISHG